MTPLAVPQGRPRTKQMAHMMRRFELTTCTARVRPLVAVDMQRI
ncbi:hypothetical protein PS862_04449 [Pseudomonas fluorescens]|uniref:Uncharacterized protein n=1 Tax=Pseudomonas fluorescens TaxID=294 RepID=A0A5E7N6T4_PSEFL|nr:hypothetical protein PS639_03015 [Pseudomonas fluorescens]VVP32559.1 hypothetical protein PS862_04449 [Pseudomonas fluorescens]